MLHFACNFLEVKKVLYTHLIFSSIAYMDNFYFLLVTCATRQSFGKQTCPKISWMNWFIRALPIPFSRPVIQGSSCSARKMS